jgi:hypothetical protein
VRPNQEGGNTLLLMYFLYDAPFLDPRRKPQIHTRQTINTLIKKTLYIILEPNIARFGIFLLLKMNVNKIFYNSEKYFFFIEVGV